MMSHLDLIIAICADPFPSYASFVHEAWRHPKTLAIISKIAGIDLVPCMDYEIGHVNVSVQGRNPEPTEAGSAAEADDNPIVDWHTDSYPFVCVLMLSDASSMVGGETALRTGDGEIIKVRGPQMVSLSHPRQTYHHCNTC